MAFEQQHLSCVAAANEFTSFHYVTADPLPIVEMPGYFNAGRMRMRTGDTITINAGRGACAFRFVSITGRADAATVTLKRGE